MKDLKRKIVLILVWGLFAGCVFDCSFENIYGATVGYTDHEHSWSGSKTCTSCNGSKKAKCSTCNGAGYTSTETRYSQVQDYFIYGGMLYYYDFNIEYRYYGCTSCSGSGEMRQYYYNDTLVKSMTLTSNRFVSGTGKSGADCSACNGQGTIYKCTKSECRYASYGNWKTVSGYSSVCYTTANTYTIAYNSNGGSGTTSGSSHTYDTAKNLTANGFSKTGYTFNGWNTKADGSGTSYADKESVKNLTAINGATVTLYAQWKANVYTITLDNQGADTAGTTAYYEKYDNGNYTSTACSATISTITKPTRTGYAFGGYYTGKNGGGTQYINEAGLISSTKTTFTEDTTLYAKWILKEHTISYNANGGTGTMGSSTISEEGGALTANMFMRKGYSFM